MIGQQGPEYIECQQPAHELLRDSFGYRYADGADLLGERDGESERQVILRDTLARKLREINGDITDATVEEAIRALEHPGAGSLIEINQKLHTLISRWITIEERTATGAAGRSVRYIDFDNPENNDFLVAEEFSVRGRNGRKRAALAFLVSSALPNNRSICAGRTPTLTLCAGSIALLPAVDPAPAMALGYSPKSSSNCWPEASASSVGAAVLQAVCSATLA